jgi:Tfp pilus assembly protein PilN
MIKINLLGKVKIKAAKPKKARRGVPTQVLQLIMLICVMLFSIGSIFFWERALAQRDEILTTEISRARKEKTRQESLLRENEAFEKRSKLLQTRLDAISDLKRNQAGPVRILDVLSECVQKTESLWLKDLTQKDNLVTLNGTVMGTPNVIADFITNLEQIGKFKNVNLLTVQEAENKYTFSITFEAQIVPKTDSNT